MYFPGQLTRPGDPVGFVALAVAAVLVAWATCMSRGPLRLPHWAAPSALTAVGT